MDSSRIKDYLGRSITWPGTTGESVRMDSFNIFMIGAPDGTGQFNQGGSWKDFILDVDTTRSTIKRFELDYGSDGNTVGGTTYMTIMTGTNIVLYDVPFAIDSAGELIISLSGPQLISHVTLLDRRDVYDYCAYVRGPRVRSEEYDDALSDIDTGLSTLNVTISPKALGVYLASPATNSLNIFPNPTSNFFNISYPINSQQLRVQLTDILGRIRAEYTLPVNTSHATLPTSSLEPGCYMLSSPIGRAKLIIGK